MTLTLTQWLSSRTPAQIAAILRTRPDAAARPVPRHLRDLAERLEIFSSVAPAAHAVPTPAIEVIEVLQLLGPDGGTRSALARWLGREPADPELNAVLDLLSDRALVWPDGDALRMARPLYATVRHPLQLGPPSAALLQAYPADQLRAIARTLDLPRASRKDALVASIAAVHADADRVRELVALAPPAARAALIKLSAEGPPDKSFTDWYGYYQYQPDPNLQWARDRGLVLLAPPGLPQVPREVAVALRGPGWHAPFTPRRPDPALAEIDDAAVRREAAAAGGAAVEQVTALLETIGAAPAAMLKAGGVGVKELRRLAKAVGADEPTVRLWLEVAYEAELATPARAGSGQLLLPTPGYDDWVAGEPADRLADLLLAWIGLSAATPFGPDPDEKPSPALLRDHSGQVASAARWQVMEFTASLPPGRAVADPTGLAPAVCWHSPLGLASHPYADRFVSAAWREAHLIGAVAHGAITPLGKALMEAPETGPAGLAEACRALLPAAVGEAIFQADLTALVPGTPAAPLAELLDGTADRETRGGAATWRFSAGSVRRALDAGRVAEALLDALRERAVGKVLPQPLEYLVTDVARRHGAVRVREVASVLRSDDPALLTELAQARALRPLRLSVIAPTVLGSAAPVAETLAALRAAGYAPVGESADGVTDVERVARQRARPAVRGRRQPADVGGGGGTGTGTAEAPDLVALAAALLAAPVPPAAPAAGSRAGSAAGSARRRTRQLRQPEPGYATPSLLLGLPGQEQDEGDADELDLDLAGDVDVAAEVEELAAHLAPGERRLLVHAIETSHPIEIEYTNAAGNSSLRVIEPMGLAGGHVIAWCQLRRDERVFAVHRIGSIGPA